MDLYAYILQRCYDMSVVRLYKLNTKNIVFRDLFIILF